MHMMAAEAILENARRRDIAGMSSRALTAAEAETVENCLLELGRQRDEAKSFALRTLAEAFKKFAPDLADELATRWENALRDNDNALADLLAALNSTNTKASRDD